MIAAGIGLVLALAFLAGAASLAHESSGPGVPPLAERIDAILPQWQCGQCGYPGCRPYAEAIASGAAGIHGCPPGGPRVEAKLAALIGGARDAGPAPLVAPAPAVALIDEELCIGCLKCVRACPVDAILGARGLMHAVLPGLCTGCGLCIEPCPVDCISLRPRPAFA